MTKMLTLFGRDLSELTYKQLKRELRVQKHLLSLIKKDKKQEEYSCIKRKRRAEEEGIETRHSQISDDKMSFADIYTSHLESIVKEIEYLLSLKIEPRSNKNASNSYKDIRERNKRVAKEANANRQRVFQLERQIANDPLFIAWDRDRFMLIAEDRGYQTEDALVHDVSEELKLDVARTKVLIDKGRFTWGQVLCLGATMQMTPKEFCDVFLAGYFTEQHGEFRADYENLNKMELLRHAIKSDPLFGIKKEIIEVGADGSSVDEEVWFDQ